MVDERRKWDVLDLVDNEAWEYETNPKVFKKDGSKRVLVERCVE